MTGPSRHFIDGALSGAPTTITPEQKRAAALYVCTRSTDREDAEMLLQMLGIVESPRPRTKPKKYGGYV